MSKLLRIQDYLLLGLAAGEDLLAKLKDPGEFRVVAFGSAYEWIPERYRWKSRLNATYQLLKTGHIEKVIKKGKPYYRLTNQGIKKVVRDFPLMKLKNRRWDGHWTIVVFDIPERNRRERDLLRRKLLSLGFGMMQRSVYISAHDIGQDLREFLVAQKLANQVFVARSKRLWAGDETALATKIWHLKKLNREYQAILDDWQKEKKTKGLKSRYLEILRRDPILPRELLPPNWAEPKVRKLLF